MQLLSFYPVLETGDVVNTAKFYTDKFGFEMTFETEWYVSLRSKSNPAFELAVVSRDHPSVPPGFRKSVQGLILNFEVEDVDAEYDRLTSISLDLVSEIKTETWGQRHFIVQDPNGILVDVIQVTEPSAEYQENYA
ncbi:MAG: VOC family protein [Gammaproteobacteria bacterium]|nr:VOC family protein [Gammaproteobacteria bacterium]MDH5618234.1 VOC family protein [Gammaproteobacteria bacterium]